MITRLLLLLICLGPFSSRAQPETAVGATYVCPPCNSHCDDLAFDEAGNCPHCKMKLMLKDELKEQASVDRKKIAFYLQDGVEILDFAGPMEVFSYAGYEVFTVSKTTEPIITQGILKIIPDYGIDDAPAADILAFFGGNSYAASQDSSVINWVSAQQGIEYYFSVCTGAFILAESGILNGKTVTTFHDALDELEQNYPEVKVLKDVRFVDNGTVITTAGISAGIDGALHLVAKLQGFNAARKTAYYMEYDKWVPGEGLILSENDPYKNFKDTDKLKEYVEAYEFLEGSEIQLKINEKEKSLYAVVQDRKYPLFFIEADTFLSISGHQVVFERNENNNVSGYKSTQDIGKSYAKLNE